MESGAVGPALREITVKDCSVTLCECSVLCQTNIFEYFVGSPALYNQLVY